MSHWQADDGMADYHHQQHNQQQQNSSPPPPYDYRLAMRGAQQPPPPPVTGQAATPADPPHWWYSALEHPALHHAPLPLHQDPEPAHQQNQNQQQQALQQAQQTLQQQLQNAQQQLQNAQQQQLLQQSQQLHNQQQHLQNQHLQSQHQQLLQAQGLQLSQGHLFSQVQQHQKQQQLVGRVMPKGKTDCKPRGKMTAYAFFVQISSEEHKKQRPEESVVFAEFSKKCAERWKSMSDKDKQKFYEMAEKDKKRFDLEMQNYIPPKGEKVRGRKRKQIKDPNAPKRSLSAFFLFCNDERGKVKAINPEYGVGDIAKELGKRWASCDPETKSKYEALSEKDKARYDREMTAYKKKLKPAVMETMNAPTELEDVDEGLDDEYE